MKTGYTIGDKVYTNNKGKNLGRIIEISLSTIDGKEVVIYVVKFEDGFTSIFLESQLQKIKPNKPSKQEKIQEVQYTETIETQSYIYKEQNSDKMTNHDTPIITLKTNMSIFRKGNTITCVLDTNGKRGVGIAKCHPTDYFNLYKGIAIAEGRAVMDREQNIINSMLQEGDI